MRWRINWKFKLKWSIIFLLAVTTIIVLLILYFCVRDWMTLVIVSVTFSLTTVVVGTCFMMELHDVKMQQRTTSAPRYYWTAAGRREQQERILALAPALLLSRNNLAHIAEFCPPTYQESAQHAQNQRGLNPPPAYGESREVEGSRVDGGNSPPPAYRAGSPATISQTVSIFMEAEYDEVASPREVIAAEMDSLTDSEEIIETEIDIDSTVEQDYESEEDTVTPQQIESTSPSSEASSSSFSPSSSQSHVFIDCLKAEPKLFSISNKESII